MCPGDREVSNLGIGERIARLRDAKGVDRHELANSIGISDKYLGMIERGVAVPSIKLLVIIAGYFDVTLEDLII